ncbi:alpha-D-ribose 1-methylphosphonate 5-triphosphate diphosphatase [Nocardia sp. NPDC059239]|uniref:alpha-D-ribose 1-methylphosphonate 5-triphosphate diphosphatase n=1 Tax=Nocardia sp. NPDC059239 TaxID=3346785 RepID=UPI0036B6DB74
MTRETVLSNATIVLEDETIRGSLRIVDGAIAEISADPTLPGTDLDGDYLLPGLVELHTDHLEHHYIPRPKRLWDPIPAVLAHDAQLAASGATTVFDAIRIGSGPGEHTLAESAHTLVNAITHASESDLLRADHLIHLRCEVASLDVIETFDRVGGHNRVKLVSLMDHTPGQRQHTDVETFRTFMIGKHKMSHAEFDEHVELMRERAKYSDQHRAEMASRATTRGITMAAHDDATRAHVAESSALGVRISEFPTTVEAARAAREAGQLVLMGAPNIVRGGSNSGNVAAAELLDLGLLDILSSDYVPASPLQAIFHLHGTETITINQGSALVSANPAAAVGLTDRGTITPGKRADLIRVRAYEDLPADQHPLGTPVPVVRGVWREGHRVA